METAITYTTAAFADTVTIIEGNVAQAVKEKNWTRVAYLTDQLKALELAECLILAHLKS